MVAEANSFADRASKAPAGEFTIRVSFESISESDLSSMFLIVRVLEPEYKKVLNFDGGPGGTGRRTSSLPLAGLKTHPRRPSLNSIAHRYVQLIAETSVPKPGSARIGALDFGQAQHPSIEVPGAVYIIRNQLLVVDELRLNHAWAFPLLQFFLGALPTEPPAPAGVRKGFWHQPVFSSKKLPSGSS